MLAKSFSYKLWADQRTLDAIENIDSTVFPEALSFVHQQLNHMVIVEELFRSRLMGESAPHKSTNTDVVPSFSELKSRILASGAWYAEYISKVSSVDLQFRFTFADGLKGMMTLEEILFHIVNHGSYHRGNIAHALDLASVPHPIDGYGIYIRGFKPEVHHHYF